MYELIRHGNFYGLGKYTVLVLLALVFAGVEAGEIKPETAWHEPAATLLDVDFRDTGFHARWEYFHCECGDILIRVEQSAPEGVLTGETLLVDGQVLLARGFEGQGSDLEPLIQAPSLMLQLAFALLHRSEPMGPARIAEKRQFTLSEKTHDFEIDIGMATGRFAAPWEVSFTAWPSGQDRRRFELAFRFSNPTEDDPDNEDEIVFSGGLDFRSGGFPLVDATPLEGWKMQWLSKGEETSSDAPAGETLGELRARMLAMSDGT